MLRQYSWDRMSLLAGHGHGRFFVGPFDGYGAHVNQPRKQRHSTQDHSNFPITGCGFLSIYLFSYRHSTDAIKENPPSPIQGCSGMFLETRLLSAPLLKVETFSGLMRKPPLVGQKLFSPNIPWQNGAKETWPWVKIPLSPQ